MARNVRVGLIQLSNPINDESVPVSEIQEAMFQKHLPWIEKAGEAGVQVLGLQEIFNGPYFCPGQDKRWYDAAEAADGPTVERLRPYAKKYEMVSVVPIYERAMAGVYYNSAVVLDADGTTVGVYRKNHIPQTSGFWEKYFFKPGNLGYPVFKTRYGKVGVYICYDRHFPEGARLLGLNGAEIVFNPSATVAGLSQYLWELEQPAHAVANGYYMAASNRIGTEAPWNIGEFYGNSYICNPRGEFLVKASAANLEINKETGEPEITQVGQDELVYADCDLDMIEEVRKVWQFYRDRRPETYGDMVKQLP